MNTKNQTINTDKNCIDFQTRIVTGTDGSFHTVEGCEIFYLLSGSVKHYFNRSVELLEPGDLFLLHPGDVHMFFACKEEYSYRDILFPEALWYSVCRFLHLNLSDNLPPPDSKIRLSMESVKSLEISFSHYHKLRTQTETPENNPYVYIILTDIIREYLILVERSDSPAPPFWLTRLVNQLSLPENAVRSRAEILSELHYSQEHICRVFKTYMHETLTDYINNKRLDHAAMLFHSTGKTVSEVCHECGFSSIAYFTRLFKARFGVSPSVYKRSSVGSVIY